MENGEGLNSFKSFRSTATKNSALLRNVGRTLTDVDKSSLKSFRTLRHFSEAQKSMLILEQDAQRRVVTNDEPEAAKQPSNRNVHQTSCYHLKKLCKSSYHELTELKSMKKALYEERSKLKSTNSVGPMIRTKGSTEIGSRQTLNGQELADTLPDILSTGKEIDHLARAREKLGFFSQSFDPTNPRNVTYITGAFHGARLSREEFRRQVNRCLFCPDPLTANEIDALFDVLSADDEGTVDGVEFTRLFFALGHEYRHLFTMHMVKSVLKQQSEKKVKEDREAER
jgi:hypothetical protein